MSSTERMGSTTVRPPIRDRRGDSGAVVSWKGGGRLAEPLAFRALGRHNHGPDPSSSPARHAERPPDMRPIRVLSFILCLAAPAFAGDPKPDPSFKPDPA